PRHAAGRFRAAYRAVRGPPAGDPRMGLALLADAGSRDVAWGGARRRVRAGRRAGNAIRAGSGTVAGIAIRVGADAGPRAGASGARDGFRARGGGTRARSGFGF